MVLVVAMHLALFAALRDWTRPNLVRLDEGETVRRLEVVLLAPPPPPAIVPPIRSAPDSPAPSPRPPPDADSPAVEAEPAPEAEALAERPVRERLFREDGSLAVSEALLRELDSKIGPARIFDYQIAGLEKSGEVFERPPALVYEATRFEGYWKPTQDVLTEVLTRAVEASTATVRIPIPGRPGWRLVCSVAVLAVSGGCGMAGPRHGEIEEDDPNTLDADEQRACDTLWEQVAGATTQSRQRQLLRLYETGCRKPFAAG